MMLRWRGEATRATERGGAALEGVLQQLGLVTRAEFEELELRVAQLEHRVKLVEGTPRAVPGPPH
jgi:polyhydroxyalkanoate synthesis regulator phasin